MSDTYTGRCQCGAVTYIATAPPLVVAQCHCDECRRLSGSGHSVGAVFSAKSVTVDGALRAYRYTAATGSQVSKYSCETCGSPIYGMNTRHPDHLTLTLGTMDGPHSLQVEVVIFDRDRPHWDQDLKQVATYNTQPDWVPPPQD